MMRIQKRSPITAPPLRYAGQSIEEEIRTIIDDKINEYAFWMVLFCGLAIFEWGNWYFAIPRMPLLYTAIALLGGGYAFIRIFLYKKKLRNLRLARDGERAVGQYLEMLAQDGYRIFHDIIGTNFNIDHVIVGTTGVYTIETKTVSKPLKGSCEITYDGENVVINGFKPDRNPIVQAKAQASWLQELIEELTAKSLKVRPVVLYPGWFISRQPKGAAVWVLNPKNLPAFLKHENSTLSPDDTKLIGSQLSRYIRESSKKSA
jgi:hypothetical protein